MTHKAAFGGFEEDSYEQAHEDALALQQLFEGKKNKQESTDNSFRLEKTDPVGEAKKKFKRYVKDELKRLPTKPAREEFKKRVDEFEKMREKLGYEWGSPDYQELFEDFFVIKPLPMRPVTIIPNTPELPELRPVTLRLYTPSMFEEETFDETAEELLKKSSITFSEMRGAWPTADTQQRKDLLKLAIKSAQSRRAQLNNPDFEPMKNLREKYKSETQISLEHPFAGITDANIEVALTAWAEGAVKEPWVLLSVWKKEGNTATTESRLHYVSNAQNAKSNMRTFLYYWRLGADHFTNYQGTGGDNTVGYDTDADATGNETAFKDRIREEVRAGRLVRDISSEINAAMNVTGNAATGFTVTTTPKFYALSLMLVDAFYRYQESKVYEDEEFRGQVDPRLDYAIAEAERLGDTDAVAKYKEIKDKQEHKIDPGFTYFRWNNKISAYNDFVKSAEKHRKEPQYETRFEGTPTAAQWAFHTKPKENEFGQSRRNAIRNCYFMDAFKLAFDGWE